ncbi:MAG: SDR family NAD(P)-dependent oxidoreductase [Acidimicrobiia bacterium]
MNGSDRKPRVTVVTGGALGIGAAIAEELGRHGAFVVTVDPGVAVDGTPGSGDTERTTAQRIVDAGGQARASNISVTDADAVGALFAELVEEFGALDAVVNVAGISRATGFASGIEDDWRAVLDVHLNGYLNTLRAALPLMAAAGHGRILGVTSGSGWRAADAGAYSCAKRAVAALTWQIGQATPSGVTVNALSPIAATRMVLGALSRQAGTGNRTGREAATGGVSLSLDAVPPPEHLGPIGAYLAGDDFAAGCRGQVMFSNGAELAWVVPPRLLEVARTTDVGSLPRLLEMLGPTVLAPAEAAQATNGGGNPRLGAAFDEPAPSASSAAHGRRAVVVTDVPASGNAITKTLTSRGVECVTIAQPATRFTAAAEQLAAVAGESVPVDAVVVALVGDDARAVASPDVPAWQRMLDEHTGITDRIATDAAWVRAVADLAAASDRPVRIVTVVDATSAGGRSRAQAAAQLSRAAHQATADRVDAFAISVESAHGSAFGRTADVAAYLVSDAGAGALSGAELVVSTDWVGLRSHPRPAGTISFGGPDVPGWLDGALRDMVGSGR